MRKIIVAVFCSLALVACGGGGESSGSPVANAPNNQVIFAAGSMIITPSTSSGNMGNLVYAGKPYAAAFANISSIGWNDGCVGWHAAGGKGKFVKYVSQNPVVIPGINPGGVGLWSVIEKGGKESSFNADHLTITGTQSSVANGVVSYGTAVGNGAFVCPATNMTPSPSFMPPATGTTPPPVIPQGVDPKHTIGLSNGSLQIGFAIYGGYILELVKNGSPAVLLVSDVHRIFWNGDVAGWSLADTAPYSTATLSQPTTGLSIPAHDNGIIRIVDRWGGIYSINTAKIVFDLNSHLSTDGRQLISF